MKLHSWDPEERLWLVWLGCCAIPFGWLMNLILFENRFGKDLAAPVLFVSVVVAWLLAGATVFWIGKRRRSRTYFDKWLVILVWSPCAMAAITIFGAILIFIVVGVVSYSWSTFL